MYPEVAKLVILAQIWTCRPLKRPIIHQRVMLEGSKTPKSPHTLVLPESVPIIGQNLKVSECVKKEKCQKTLLIFLYVLPRDKRNLSSKNQLLGRGGRSNESIF